MEHLKLRKAIVLIFIFSLMIVAAYRLYEMSPGFENTSETNYKGLVMLKLAPNAFPRVATEKDFDTGIKFTDGKEIYTMYSSREISKGDYGKTFIGIKE